MHSRSKSENPLSATRSLDAYEPEPLRPDPGLVAGRYRLQERLGTGGMGSVYRALDEGTGRTVALKVLRSSASASRDLFRLEFRTLAKLTHPCVIQVFEHGEGEGDLYYTMELLSGRDLLAAAPLPWQDACRALRDVATSLALLHSQRLVHRDVNPRNVRLTDAGPAKLLDFGTLSAFGKPNELMGTPSCIAPEALRGRPLDARTDLFSLGVVAYWALTGRVPYAVRSFDEAEAAWQTPPLPPSHYVAALPAGVDALLLSLLSIDPLGRPQSAADLIDRLSALASLEDEPLWSIAESHVTSATLVGRDREQARLREILHAAQEGHGTALTIIGERGTGKTRLLRELSIRAQLSGFTTLHISAEGDCSSEAVLHKIVAGLRECAPRELRESPMFGSATLMDLFPEPDGSDTGKVTERTGDPFEHERILRMQLDVSRLVCDVAAQRSLLITFDGADTLSATSASILPILAQSALGRTLVVAVSRRPAATVPAVEQLSSLGAVMRLQDLNDAAVEQLLHDIFGDVPHRARLARWLLLASRGNPGRIRIALLHLFSRRVVRYGGGAWLLPSDLSDLELPKGTFVLTQTELAQLSEPARELMYLIACHHGALDAPACARLVSDADAVLDELQQRRLIVRDRKGVRLAQASAGRELRAELSIARRRALHATLAHALTELYPRQLESLMRGATGTLDISDILLGIGTGLHLLIAGHEQEATLLLRHGAVELTVRGDGLNAAAPVLEEAVEIYRALGRGQYVYAGMMSALTLAGTYSDWRLSYRYAEEFLSICSAASGLRWAERLAPYAGKRLALSLCLALAFLLFVLRPKRRMVASFRTILLGLVGLGTGAVAVCAVMMDPERAVRLTTLLGPLGYFPKGHPAREVHGYQLALRDHALGRYGEARRHALDALSYLRSSPARSAFPEPARVQLEGGVLILLGQLDACRTDAQAQQTIADISRVQTSTSRQTYSTTLMTYHANRGEREAYVQWRETTDRLAAEEGSTWRNDVQVPRMVWSVHALCEDVLTLKRDMEQLRALASQVPTVARLRDVLNACYLCERGMPNEALTRYESVLQAAELESGVRATQQLGAYARILRKAGRAADAVKVCEHALERLSPDERELSSLIFGAQLELPLSLVVLGEHARAKQILTEMLRTNEGHDNALRRGLLHSARAEVALAERDWCVFEEHAEAMSSWFRKTQHPALLAQCQRLVERARSARAGVVVSDAKIGRMPRDPKPSDSHGFETEAMTPRR